MEAVSGPAFSADALEGSVWFRGPFDDAAPTSAVELGLERAGMGHDARRDAVDRWRVALAEHDDDEVERLVQQSRADRVEGATSGRLGAWLGGAIAPDPDVVIP